MRILVANKFWYPRGGQERVMFDEIGWLEEAGHQVAHFSTTHPDNLPSPWSDYFLPYLELGEHGDLDPLKKAAAAGRMFYSPEARRRFARLIDAFQPDIVHVHGIHRQLSPSILDAARSAGVPAVQTLHDCHHVCPDDVLRLLNGESCEPRRCGVLWYGPCVGGRCVRGSLIASALAASEVSWQRVRRAYEKGLARFISPSGFLAQTMRAGDWKLPIDIVPNAVSLRPPAEDPGRRFVVAGRLDPQKGVAVALEAARETGLEMTVAGDGPEAASLRERYPEAHFLGRLDREAVDELVRGSRALLLPSTGSENAPISVLEAMAAGKPVVASAVGGVPELLSDGVEGLLVPPGDVTALAQAMTRLADDDALCRKMGEAGRQAAETRFSPGRHVAALLETYRAAGASRSSVTGKEEG